MGYEVGFSGVKDNPTVKLATGITRGTDEGKVVKISANKTVALCEANEKFDGVLKTIDRDGIGVMSMSGFHGLPYTGSAPSPGRRKLAANGSGGVKVPASGVTAYLVTGAVVSNNAIRFTAKDAVGALGNDIHVELKDPAGNSKSLSVGVEGEDITVNLATDGSGAITSTAAQIIAAIAASGAAGIITAANETGSSGAGVVEAAARTALANGVDEGDGVECRIIDVDTENAVVWAHIG